MSEKRWTKEDFVKIARPRIAAGLADPSTFQQHLFTFLTEAAPHVDGATAEGKEYMERAIQGLISVLNSNLQNAVDTAETRQLKRAISSFQGKHFLAKDLMDVFEETPPSSDRWTPKAIELFTKTLQSFLDIMHDVTRGIQKGAAGLARVGLFYWLIDELLAAQSLARRHHSTLSYSTSVARWRSSTK